MSALDAATLVSTKVPFLIDSSKSNASFLKSSNFLVKLFNLMFHAARDLTAVDFGFLPFNSFIEALTSFILLSNFFKFSFKGL